MGEIIIDIDYTGEIGVVLFHPSARDFRIQVGHRIAHLILEKIKTTALQIYGLSVQLLGTIEDFLGEYGIAGQ